MQKSKKLSLRTETVRLLNVTTLKDVNGGAGQANCPTSKLAETCSNYQTHTVYCGDPPVSL